MSNAWQIPDNEDWHERYNKQHALSQKARSEQDKAEKDREKAERQVRDLTRNRDHWKERAVVAENMLKSLGAK